MKTSVSARFVIDRVLRDFKPVDSSWLGDVYDMIGEAVELIGYHAGFEGYTYQNQMVEHGRWFIPGCVQEIDWVTYNGIRIPVGRDQQLDTRVKDNYVISINHDVLLDLERYTEQYQALEDAKQGATPEDVIEYTERQEEVLAKITSAAQSLGIKSNNVDITGVYYRVEWPLIVTSFEEGAIDIKVNRLITDNEGYPMVINSAKYIEACFWYIAQKLLLQGYQHPVLNYQLAYAQWEDYRHRASNEAKIMGTEAHENFGRMWNQIRFQTNAFDRNFLNLEQR